MDLIEWIEEIMNKLLEEIYPEIMENWKIKYEKKVENGV